MRNQLQRDLEKRERQRQWSRRVVVGFLAFLVVSAGVLVWSTWRQAVRQEAARKLNRAGAVLHYASSCPDWVLDSFGETTAYLLFPKRVREISAAPIEEGEPSVPSAMTDDEMPLLKHFTRLESLDLRGSQVTDIGLVHLRGLNRLEHLDLRGTQVTEPGVGRLKEALPNVEIQR